jgi:hypothetical protein
MKRSNIKSMNEKEFEAYTQKIVDFLETIFQVFLPLRILL